MRILAVDVGTGTQDILLFDSDKEAENCFKMVLPSPTVLVADQIREATRRGEAVLLIGALMGGGPSQWAASDHLRAGYKVYATPSAALSFNDELAEVEKTGTVIVGEDEAARLKARRVVTGDFHYEQIARAFDVFGVKLEVDALAVAVFDHGHAPPGISDRRFRFDYLAQQIQQQGRLSAFAFLKQDIPPHLTRMRAVAESIETDVPLLLMDTAPAAILGALEDPQAREPESSLIVNVGNFHTLAFHMGDGEIKGLFEHHTGELTREELEAYLDKLARGVITNDEVFADMGHGALVFDPSAAPPTYLTVIGPRRNLLRGSSLQPYFAVPHGDMMMAGCWGLVRAFGEQAPECAGEIRRALGSG